MNLSALEGLEKVLGAEHVQTLQTVETLARILQA